MKSAFFVSILVVAVLFVEGAIAQHEGHQVPQAATTPEKPADKTAPPCGMMAANAEASKLAGQLEANLAAIESETDSAALKAKLAEHGKLLKELQAKLQEPAKKMESMKGKMMKGKMMGGNNKQ